MTFNDGNPYGASHVAANGANPVGDEEFDALDHLAERAVAVAERLQRGIAA